MTPGTRVKFNEHCVWPERVGCEGMIVAPKMDGTYPRPGPSEVIVYLDRDPLAERASLQHRGDAWWTCVTTRASLDVIE